MIRTYFQMVILSSTLLLVFASARAEKAADVLARSKAPGRPPLNPTSHCKTAS